MRFEAKSIAQPATKADHLSSGISAYPTSKFPTNWANADDQNVFVWQFSID